MKLIIITCCLIGAAFANPILHNILVSTESESNSTKKHSHILVKYGCLFLLFGIQSSEENTSNQSSESESVESTSEDKVSSFQTESLSVLESSENNTSELQIQSSEENTSNQSSESESVESTSEDKNLAKDFKQRTFFDVTDNEKLGDNGEEWMDSMAETKDNSMGSEENVRKSWVRVFPSIIEGASGEDNTSTEVTGHPAAASDSTDSSSSSESQESQETSDSNDSSTASKSTEDSNASDSAELEQVRAKNCVNSTQSCESEEYFLQSIGDDAHSPGEHLLVPDEDERELRLR
uniref:Secretory calcium-binding phosphoprotein 1 n=1 Tax=Poecilia formosa TaxID=48698 RepID=A0A096M5U2_POEFO